MVAALAVEDETRRARFGIASNTLFDRELFSKHDEGPTAAHTMACLEPLEACEDAVDTCCAKDGMGSFICPAGGKCCLQQGDECTPGGDECCVGLVCGGVAYDATPQCTSDW